MDKLLNKNSMAISHNKWFIMILKKAKIKHMTIDDIIKIFENENIKLSNKE